VRGLRGRVSAFFAIGALGVSLVLALTTYAIASSYLLGQRYVTVQRQAVFNAGAVRGALATTDPAIPALLEQLDASGGESSSPLVYVGGRWYDDQLPRGHDELPDELVAAARDGVPVRQRFRTPDGLAVAVALPLEGYGAAYLEVFSLRELDQTLRTLAVTFTGTATMTTALGLLLGLWASRRALRPLRTVNAAAAAIADGDLDTRLKVQRDKDLIPLAEAFNRTATRLQRRVERDVRFAGNVSHELRSPLTTMVNAVGVLGDRAHQLDAESREVLTMLEEDVQRLARMVEDLLEISRLESGVATVRREPVALGALVRSVANRCAGRPVTTVDASATTVVSWVDRRRVERVVENLVRNAETHGQGVSRVLVSSSGETVTIAVEDDGPGVSPVETEQVFERFARGSAKGSSRAEGVGLGLSLVMEHVRLHGGAVRVENRPVRGARFVVDLPVEP
jgi:signal transduction histidine kinase